MIEKKRFFTLQFKNQLVKAGYPLTDIERVLKDSQKPDIVGITQSWTNIPAGVIKENIWQEERDGLLPLVKIRLETILQPWITTQTDKQLPTIRIRDLARATRLPPQKIEGLLTRHSIPFAINGTSLTAKIEPTKRDNDDKKQTVFSEKDARNLGISLKRIARDSRYLSRPPGGGPVQKARVVETTRTQLIRQRIIEKTIVQFVRKKEQKIEPEDKTERVRLSPIDKEWYAFIELGANPSEIETLQEVMHYFDSREFNNKIPGRNQLREQFLQLSQGREVPVIIFNCLPFDWVPQEERYPQPVILDETDTAICGYYEQELTESLDKLKKIGNPKPIIIIPDSEAFDERLWIFQQSTEEREKIIESVKQALTTRFQSLTEQYGLSVQTWSQYCQENNLQTPRQYTEENYFRIKNSPQLSEKIKNQINKDRFYLARYIGRRKAREIPDNEYFERLCWYYAMYAGEGQAQQDLRAININFEEGRVQSWYEVGAKDELPSITPVKDTTTYYKERDKIKGIGMLS